LIVIAVVSTANGNGTFGNTNGGGYATFGATWNPFSGPFIPGPKYTVQLGPVQCAEQSIDNLFSNMKSLAEWLIGGAAGAYANMANWSKVTAAANAFLDGTMSIEEFWIIIASIITSVTLADILFAALAGVALGVILETLACLIYGS